MKNNLNDESFYTVFGWMVNKLKLTGNEVNVYAVIYGYSQNGIGEFIGSRKYIMSVSGIKSNKTIYKILKNLVDKGYILEFPRCKTNGYTNVYKAVPKEELFKRLEGCKDCKKDSPTFNSSCERRINSEEGISKNEIANDVFFTHSRRKNYTSGSVESTPSKCKNYTSGSVEITRPYNKEYIYNYKKEINIKDKIEERKKENKYIGEIKEKSSEGVLGETNYGRERYVEIMDRYGLTEKVKSVLFKFIAHCNLNGKMLTNDKLERIIIYLQGKKEDGEREKILLRAIDKGYCDVLKEESGKSKSSQGAEKSNSSAHFKNERKYTDEYFESLVTKMSDIKI